MQVSDGEVPNTACGHVTGFVDPRSDPTPPWIGERPNVAEYPADVAPLVAAIRFGRLYEAEAWICAGRPIQCARDQDRHWSHTTALYAALGSGSHAATLLLLCNGYDPGQESDCPFAEALRVRRRDLVDLLLAWGADAREAEPQPILGTHDKALIEDFWRRGTDFNRDGALADALAYSTTNKPLYGFVKRHRIQDPSLQRGLDQGLVAAVERQLYALTTERERASITKAVSLCIWAGADPWKATLLPDEEEWALEDEEEEEDSAVSGGGGEVADRSAAEAGASRSDDLYWSAAARAVRADRPHLIQALKLERGDARIQCLYEWVRSIEAFDLIAALRAPLDLGPVVATAAQDLERPIFSTPAAARRLLLHVLESGHRLAQLDDWACDRLKGWLRSAARWEAEPVVRLLQDPQRVELSLFLRLIASPKLLERAGDVGISAASVMRLAEAPEASQNVRAVARRWLRKHARSDSRR